MMILAQSTQALLNSGDYVAMPKWIAYIGGLALGLTALSPIFQKLWDSYFGVAKKIRDDLDSLKTRAATAENKAVVAEQVAVAAKQAADVTAGRVTNIAARQNVTDATVQTLALTSMPPPLSPPATELINPPQEQHP